MNKNASILDLYNENVYLNILNHLYTKLDLIEKFLNSIDESQNFKKIDDLKDLFDDIFADDFIFDHINFKITKIVHSLSLWRNETDLDRSNSYYHLTLTLKSEEIVILDDIYGNILSKVLRFYKHLFSKIDNFYIKFKPEQFEILNVVLDKIKLEIKKFLEVSERRDIITERLKLDEQKLNNLPFGGLFYISHIDNVESILKYGILSHNLAHSKELVKVDISHQEVNPRRNRFENSLGGNIHDFAPLYFNQKNPMLYKLCKTMDRNNLVLFRINPHILLANEVSFSDGNAASHSTNYYNNIDDFNKLNWKLIKQSSWYNYEFGVKEGGRIMCSEVLVKNKIPLFVINDIFVYDEKVLDRIIPLFPNHFGIKTFVNKSMYF